MLKEWCGGLEELEIKWTECCWMYCVTLGFLFDEGVFCFLSTKYLSIELTYYFQMHSLD